MTIRRVHRQERGAAVVELALGSLVFISILLFGIFFGEVGFVGLKTTEAMNFALFDASGREMHSPQGNGTMDFNKWHTSAQNAANNAEYHYGTLDGRSSHAGSHGNHVEALAQVDVRGNNGVVKVFANTGPSHGPATVTTDYVASSLGAGINYGPAAGNNGQTGFGVQTEAIVTSVRMPRRFLTHGSEHGFFNVNNYSGTPIHMCGIGRAVGGSCNSGGEVQITLDDWGWSGYAQGQACPLSGAGPGCPGKNESYYKTAKAIYQASAPAGGQGNALVGIAGGSAGVQDGEFDLSFVGADAHVPGVTTSPAAFVERNPGGSAQGSPNDQWQTTPFALGDHTDTPYYFVWQRRKNQGGCFMGLDRSVAPCP